MSQYKRYSMFLVGNVLLILFPCKLLGWGTVEPWETHKRITQNAVYDGIDKIDSEYPDLWRFREKLQSGSHTESHLMPGDDGTQWWGCGVGPGESVWFTTTTMKLNGETGALFYYKTGSFSEAYKHIGYELHMLQRG